MRRRVLIIITLMVLLLLVLVAYHFYSQKTVNVETTRSDYALDSDSILSAFHNAPAIASSTYIGKMVTLSGILQQVDTLGNNTTLVIGSSRFKGSVRCSMDSIFPLNISLLSLPSRIRIKGICTGYNEDDILGNDLILNRCKLLKGSIQ